MTTHLPTRLEQAVLGTVAGSVLGRGDFPLLMVNLAPANSQPEAVMKS